jgi:hypothetical protein
MEDTTYEFIKKLDHSLFKILHNSQSKYNHLISSGTYKSTTTALLNFINKSEQLKIILWLCYEQKNFTSWAIIFRSFIEYYLKFFYLVTKSVSLKSDMVGNNYLEVCAVQEKFEYIKGKKAAEDIQARRYKLYSFEDYYKEYDVPKQIKNRKHLDEIVKEFEYKKIVSYLHKHFMNDKQDKASEFISKLIPQYSLLSSFVHGGPSADDMLNKWQDNDALKTLEGNLPAQFLITASMIEQFFFYIDNQEHNFESEKLKINTIINSAMAYFSLK